MACGLHLSRKSSGFFSPGVRLQAWAVWDSLTFILNGLVFVLIGLQLPNVLAGIHNYNLLTLVLYGALFSALLIALRMLWVFPGARMAYWIRIHLLHQKVKCPTPRGLLVLGMDGHARRNSSGCRYGVAANPLADGGTFPQRNPIIFLAFSAILVTLVLQGTTLPWVVRLLGRLPRPMARIRRKKRHATRCLEAALG